MKDEVIKVVVVDEDSSYECPECGCITCLDSYDFIDLHKRNGKILRDCPMCSTKLKLVAYE